MGKPKLVAIDLAKQWYQVGGYDEQGREQYNRRYSAKQFAQVIQQLAPTVIAMEACGAAHHWGRKLQGLGHEVRLVPAQHTQAFRRVHKSDAHDVMCIAEAARRPGLHFVPVKSLTQQDLQLLVRLREGVVQERTALINRVRGLAREYGVNLAQGRARLMAQLPQVLEEPNSGLTHIARAAFSEQLRRIRALDEQHAQLMEQLRALAQQDPAYQRLLSIPGIGPTIAPALLASIAHAQQFTHARSCAAWLGLVPKQSGTGGRVHLGGITKNGSRSLRTQLIHGARAVMRWAHRQQHAQSQWIQQLVARRGKNIATVALANKLMRIVWVVLTQQVSFQMDKAFRAQPAR